jgi:hypothetical protein
MTLPRPTPGTLKWWVVGTIGISLGVAVAVWLGLASTLGKPQWDTTGYKVVDDQSVRVDFQVYSPGGKTLTCTIKALARDFSIVGSVDVEVAVPQGDEARSSVTVRTTSRAVTGEVRRCVSAP